MKNYGHRGICELSNNPAMTSGQSEKSFGFIRGKFHGYLLYETIGRDGRVKSRSGGL